MLFVGVTFCFKLLQALRQPVLATSKDSGGCETTVTDDEKFSWWTTLQGGGLEVVLDYLNTKTKQRFSVGCCG